MEILAMPPLTLAYLGDAVFELYVRSRLVQESKHKPRELHRQAVRRVRAQAQARALHRIADSLTPAEADVVRRGRNAHTGPQRSIEPVDYHYSTAFEALLGYLYLTGQTARLEELMARAYEMADENGQT